jgi:hypothetical protein
MLFLYWLGVYQISCYSFYVSLQCASPEREVTPPASPKSPTPPRDLQPPPAKKAKGKNLLSGRSKPKTSSKPQAKEQEEDEDDEGDDNDDDDEDEEGNDDDDGDDEEDDGLAGYTEDERQTIKDLSDSPVKIPQNPKTKGKGKRPRQKPMKIPNEVATEIIDWLRENEILYNRGKEEYLESSRKMELWNEKAKELTKKFPDLQLTGAKLLKWYQSQRDMYVKLKNKLESSGSGSRRLTDHQEWLMKVFPFINKHVFLKSGKQASKKVSKHYVNLKISIVLQYFGDRDKLHLKVKYMNIIRSEITCTI